jgi:hypothetical protein
MPRTVNQTHIDDPVLIEKVAIAIFERTQGSWEYAREADREWLRLEAQAAIVTCLTHIEERNRTSPARSIKRQQPLLELILHRPVGGMLRVLNVDPMIVAAGPIAALDMLRHQPF